MQPAIDWQTITRDLAAPFAPELVEWRPQVAKKGAQRAQVIAYLSSAAIQDRLDAVCPGWSFTWEPLVVAEGDVRVAKGALAIGGVTREDVGTASNWEPSKGAVTDALKRCASLWGIGRYLRSLPTVWVELDDKGNIPADMLAKLRQSLARYAAPSSAA